MKNLVLVLMLLYSGLIFSQEYYPLVSEDKLWNTLMVTENGPYPWDTVYETKTYKFEGDTIFNNITYSTIWASSAEIPVNWTFRGGIREVDKKVWSVYNAGSEENLLYDFSLNIGDTMVFDEGYVEMIIDTITWVNINNTQRKKYHLRYYSDPTIYETWIEGIGSSLGILTSGTEGWDGGGNWFLCMAENGQLVYMNPNFNSCYFISTGYVEFQNTGFSITPNPTNSYFSIKVPENVKVTTIVISDLSGREIKVFESNHIICDVSGIKPGIYLYTVQTSNFLRSGKIIITN